MRPIARADGPFPVQHYCFRVSELGFDGIVTRIRARGIDYRSTPHGPVDVQVNTLVGQPVPGFRLFHTTGESREQDMVC